MPDSGVAADGGPPQPTHGPRRLRLRARGSAAVGRGGLTIMIGVTGPACSGPAVAGSVRARPGPDPEAA